MRFQRADPSQAAIVDNLLQLYMHDMSEWFGVTPDDSGRFEFVEYEQFQTGEPVYLAFDDEQTNHLPAGFALVAADSEYPGLPEHYDLEEFFLMRRYRHQGVAERFATHVWDELRGTWIVRVFEGNLPAVTFWRRAVSRYTDSYTVETQGTDGSRWLNFQFDNRAS